MRLENVRAVEAGAAADEVAVDGLPAEVMAGGVGAAAMAVAADRAEALVAEEAVDGAETAVDLVAAEAGEAVVSPLYFGHDRQTNFEHNQEYDQCLQQGSFPAGDQVR
jgi:hypothetical protein